MKTQYDVKETEKTVTGNESFDLSIIPVSTNKIPFDPWAEYQTKIAPISYWHSHYVNQGTIGIITGQISGNLECIDIDIKNDPLKTIICLLYTSPSPRDRQKT